jgi:hypothetical protein
MLGFDGWVRDPVLMVRELRTAVDFLSIKTADIYSQMLKTCIVKIYLCMWERFDMSNNVNIYSSQVEY